MLINGKEVKILKLDDINSEVSLSEWLKTNVKNEMQYSRINVAKSKRYIEYIKYIRDQVYKQPLDNKSEWFEQLDRLKDAKDK
jgi:hypothetical protein